jgi:chromosome segregation ATPase
MWNLAQVSPCPLPAHVDFAEARRFLAELLKTETSGTERNWCRVGAEEISRPPKRHRPNETALIAEPSPIASAEALITDQLASLHDSIQTWTARYQDLRMQYGELNSMRSLQYARFCLERRTDKLSRQKERVDVARREHDAALAALEVARSQFQATLRANPDSGQPVRGTDASYAVELREAENDVSAAHEDLEKQRSLEREMQSLIGAAKVAIEVELQRQEIQGSLHKLLESVSQPWLPTAEADT